jgi:cytochrome P450
MLCHAACALQIVAQSNTFILAGYETTANTLSFSIYNIARDPEVERRLLQEVDQFGRDRRVTYQDLDKVGPKTGYASTALMTPTCPLSHGWPTLQHYVPRPVACERLRHCMFCSTVLPLSVGTM